MRGVMVRYKSMDRDILVDIFVGPDLIVTYSKGEAITLFVGRRNFSKGREKENERDVPVDMLAVYAPGEWISANEISEKDAMERLANAVHAEIHT